MRFTTGLKLTWLTQRTQRVVLDGEVSDQASGLSGVTRGATGDCTWPPNVFIIHK